MILLALGLIIFTLLHLIPVFFSKVKAKLIESNGPLAYKGGFAATALLAVALIIAGWSEADPAMLYDLGPATSHMLPLLMLVAFISVSASLFGGRIARRLRHPLLFGVLLWAGGHLLAVGSVRATLLFTVFFIWGLVMLVGSEKRRRANNPSPPLRGGLKRDIGTVVLGLIAYIGMLAAHPHLIGVSPLTFG